MADNIKSGDRFTHYALGSGIVVMVYPDGSGYKLHLGKDFEGEFYYLEKDSELFLGMRFNG